MTINIYFNETNQSFHEPVIYEKQRSVKLYIVCKNKGSYNDVLLNDTFEKNACGLCQPKVPQSEECRFKPLNLTKWKIQSLAKYISCHYLQKKHS